MRKILINHKPFGSIPNMNKSMQVTITQKFHGTNAVIYIPTNKELGEIIHTFGDKGVTDEERLKELVDFHSMLVGSRNRWLTEDADNHEFYKWCMERKDILRQALGSGLHYGEFVGKGIGSGEGFEEKSLILFNVHKFGGKKLYKVNEEYRFVDLETINDSRLFNGVDICDEKVGSVEYINWLQSIPVLYRGNLAKEVRSLRQIIDEVMLDLKTNGSKLVKGFMNVEGVVIKIGEESFKEVFDAEETAWTKAPKVKTELPQEIQNKITALAQPLRLEKLLGKDTSFYDPSTNDGFKRVLNAYCEDLLKEGQMDIDFYTEYGNKVKSLVGKMLRSKV